MDAQQLADAINGAQRITPVGPKVDVDGEVLNADEVGPVASGLSLAESDVIGLVDTFAENPDLYTEFCGMVNRTRAAERSLACKGYWGKDARKGNHLSPDAHDHVR